MPAGQGAEPNVPFLAEGARTTPPPGSGVAMSPEPWGRSRGDGLVSSQVGHVFPLLHFLEAGPGAGLASAAEIAVRPSAGFRCSSDGVC